MSLFFVQGILNTYAALKPSSLGKLCFLFFFHCFRPHHGWPAFHSCGHTSLMCHCSWRVICCPHHHPLLPPGVEHCASCVTSSAAPDPLLSLQHMVEELMIQFVHAWSACTALWLPGAVLRASRARCNAVALPSFACFECMHSIMALSSRAVCLLARCKAFALPNFAC